MEMFLLGDLWDRSRSFFFPFLAMVLPLKHSPLKTPPPPPTSFSLLDLATLEPLLISILTSAATLPHLKTAHALLLRLHLHHNPFFVTKLLRRLSSLPPSSYPSLIFSHVPPPHRNSFLWTALIRSPSPSPSPLRLYSSMLRQVPPAPPLPFTLSALLTRSPTLFTSMQLHAHCLLLGFTTNLPVNNALITAYVNFSDLPSARKLFDYMPVRDLISWTTLIVAYTKTWNLPQAEALFESAPVKDAVTWTAMVTGYVQNARPREALDVFVRMMDDEEAIIDEVALVGAVSACAQLGAGGKAVWVEGIAGRTGLLRNVVVGSALVDMYGKCGLIEEARRVFDGMPERNVYTYSAMIMGLAIHGRAGGAIELFGEMVGKTDVRPNRVTFVGVLTACSHAGMVEEGRFYFSRMKDEYGIAPTADHFVCMVDLLGRAGRVEEALELVRSMQVEPHSGVWGALLGACRIHGNVQIAEIAADHLFKLEPDGVGNYVLLANTYASARMWDEVSKVRKLMRKRGLRKDPSSSWVEAKDGVVHEFFAGDVVHPWSREIKEELEKLLGQLKLVGYVPNMNSVVYDVSDDEKERLLKGHSEKIALAFGVLTTDIGSTIKIMKNLRICEDCHSMMCFASSVISRVIVVRDNMRFHHFRNGQCSCGGFW